jgi:hypothetical protein
MDTQSIINVGGGIILTGIGWFARQIWEATQSLQHDVHQIEVDLPKNYVRRDEYSSTMMRIEDMFQRIFDKLEGKVDK